MKYLEDDQLSVNIFTEKPNNFGLEAHYDATWYTYEQFENYEEAQNSDKEEFEGLSINNVAPKVLTTSPDAFLT